MKYALLAFLLIIVPLAIVTKQFNKDIVPAQAIAKASFEAKRNAAERVVESGVLRCGYGLSPPILQKDAKTNKLVGSDHAIMEAIGKKLDLKIEWATEAGWGSFIEDLRSNRFDAMCTGIWPDAGRIKHLSLTRPVYYDRLMAYAREGDIRFDGNLNNINQKNITIAVVEGDASAALARTQFPKAKILALPQMALVSDMLIALTSKKADVIFLDPVRSALFQANNPGQIRMVENVKPVQVYGVSIAVKAGETQLRDMLDTALRELINDGTVARELAKISPDIIAPKPEFE